MTNGSNQSPGNELYDNSSGLGISSPIYIGTHPDFVVIFGILSPIVVLVTLVTNTLVCNVLVKPAMKSPVNILLLALAFTDTLTGLCPLPIFIYFYSMGNSEEYVSPPWCYAYKIFYSILPTVFHTASVWLTMALAIQRYIYVCHPVKGKYMCTNQTSIKISATIMVLSLLVHSSRFIDLRFTSVEWPSLRDPNTTIQVCVEENWAVPVNSNHAYFQVYFTSRIMLIHIIPCAFLIIMNGILLAVMRKAQWKRRSLIGRSSTKNKEWRTIHETNCTTLMLIVVVGIFLLVEVPQGLIFTLNVLDNLFGFTTVFVESKSFATTHIILNFVILLSYPLNFFIYAGMSRSFRTTAKSTVVKFWKNIALCKGRGARVMSTMRKQPSSTSMVTNSEMLTPYFREDRRSIEAADRRRKISLLTSVASATSYTSV